MAAILQQPPEATVVSASTDGNSKRKKYKDVIYGLGISEVVIGVLLVILGIANIGKMYSLGWSYYYYRYYFAYLLISPSIWCGALLIASGAVGIRTKQNPSTCMYNANMGLSIIAAFAMLVLFIMSVISCIIVGSPGIVAIHSLLSVGGFTALVVCIVHSAYCCAGTCCVTRANQGQVLYLPAQPPQQQYIQLANGQYALLQTPYPAGYPAVAIPPGVVPQQPMYVHPGTNVQQPMAPYVQPPAHVQQPGATALGVPQSQQGSYAQIPTHPTMGVPQEHAAEQAPPYSKPAGNFPVTFDN